MNSVDRAYRPNALGFSTLMVHLLGDVPAPIFFGWLKDTLAPNCVISSTGNFIDVRLCLTEQRGIRQCLLMAYLWTIWSMIFLEIARRLALERLRNEKQATIGNLVLPIAGSPALPGGKKKGILS
eukprot:CAMPEP_0171305174 /NCGR_PEP_ID=MMETSP0816-20121228/14966_1 /TAXON_ID=420281 /ORGANISM="Proboscia inermis, Strain CCAP1064/1" /LENGTH=124 /DNA_ID=CAMNT_0011785789 /DNA_START=70 /DNA_END=444 /DNA_ORIENTATION=-